MNATFLALPLLATATLAMAETSWPGFRGAGDSTTAVEDLPLTWSDTEGIAWKAELAGYGQSSPVIWGDHAYVTSTGGDNKEKLFVEAFDLKSGSKLWVKEIAATQTAAEVSGMISRGAPTPATDGDGVYAFFESGDLVALDHDGETLWDRSLTKEFGAFMGHHGIGTSLVNTPETLVILIDHEGPSYLLSVDKKTGESRWKIDREPRVSWATPLYLSHAGVEQIVISSNGVLESYALKDGERIWWVDGIEKNTVASPTSDGEVVVIGSSGPGQSIAVKLGGSGDVSATHLKWRAESVTSSFGSPLIHGESVFFVNRAGALQASNLADGSLKWEQRLPGSCWASPLSAGDRIYFFCKTGQTVVLDSNGDSEPKELALNVLPVAEDDRLYGYAVAPGRIVMRTGSELIAVGP